jgi:L-iditol 2-dehydrogenase
LPSRSAAAGELLEAVIAAPGEVRVRRRRAPARPRAGEVTVEVEHVTLCGSDFALFRGDYGAPGTYPIRFGHEWSGRVATAPAGSPFRPGDRVTGDCSRWCGACEPCARDRNLCRRIEKFGITTDGFSVRRRTVPERYLYRDPHGLPGELLALAEIFAVGLRGVARGLAAAAGTGECLVVGGGPLGVVTALLLRHHRGGSPVWLLERDARKAALLAATFPQLRHLAAAAVPELAERPSYAELHQAARFPLVCECSGSSGGLDTALRLARVGGTVVAFGLGRPGVVDMRLVVTKGLALLGSIGGTGAFPAAMAFLAGERETAARLITHRFAVERAAEALAGADPLRLKVQLSFQGDPDA